MDTPKTAPSPHEINLFVELFEQGKFTEAKNIASEMIVNYPNHGVSWKSLGTIQSRLGLNSEALSSLQKAVKMIPDDAVLL